MQPERLDKILSGTGKYTRSEARRLIQSGAVTADGVPVRSPETKIPREAVICAAGEVIDAARFVYYMMNKPAGYVSAARDAHKPAVLELLPEELRRRGVACVGRLDADVTGLLILTDDGDYAHRVMAPGSAVPKTYEVLLDAPVGAEEAALLASGVTLPGGTEYRPALLVPDRAEPRRARVTVTEGKYHEVKNLMAVCGRRVQSMRRLSVGALTLDEALAPGGYRRLSEEERALVFHENV